MKKKNNNNELITKDYLDKKLDQKFGEFAIMVQKGFKECASKTELAEVKQDVKVLKQDVNVLKQDVKELKEDISGIKSTMATKAFMEDKMTDLESSTILRQKKEDKRFKMLVEFLSNRKVITKTEFNTLQEIQVFPTVKLA